MRRLLHLTIGVALLTQLCSTADAQRHGRPSSHVVSPPAARQRAARTLRFPAVAGQTSLLTPDTILTSGIAPVSVEMLLGGGFPVPGLGFDFPHLAAVNRGLGVRALIDPVTQHQLALARQILRETPAASFGAPFFLNTTPLIITLPQPVVVLQTVASPAGREEFVEEEHQRARQREEGAPAARAPEPPHELGEFVLVRRDGSLAFAVAFTAERDRIVYITREGNRRTLSLADLDVEATLQMNEERGTSIRLPV